MGSPYNILRGNTGKEKALSISLQSNMIHYNSLYYR